MNLAAPGAVRRLGGIRRVADTRPLDPALVLVALDGALILGGPKAWPPGTHRSSHPSCRPPQRPAARRSREDPP